MQILIIEDDILWQTKIEMLLYDINKSWIIESVNNISKARTYLENRIPDIIIADILLENDTIYKLLNNESYTNIPIVFITISEDEMFYNLSKAFSDSNYLIKPFPKLSLKSAIEKTMLYHKRRLSRNAKGITVRGIHNEKIDLKAQDIVYIESKKNYCILKTLKNQYALKISLTKLLEDLSPDLIQAHKTYLVNKKYIAKISRSINEINTEIGAIPIGRKYKDNILNYLEEKRNNKI